MSKHTPTPWTLGALPPAGWRYICDANGETVAAVAEWNENSTLHLEFPNAKANARLIVRAVNSHADLLSALKEMTDLAEFAIRYIVDAGMGVDFESKGITAGFKDESGSLALAAIRKAEQ